MRAIIEKKVMVTLVLTAEEARWLKGMVQNPISEYSFHHGECHGECHEKEIDKEMRGRFWEALKGVRQLGERE